MAELPTDQKESPPQRHERRRPQDCAEKREAKKKGWETWRLRTDSHKRNDYGKRRDKLNAALRGGAG